MIEKLQALPEPTKKKVLIAATGVAMIIVIYFWLAYFNNLVASVAQPSVVESRNDQARQGAQDAEPAADSSFFESMGNGATFLSGQFMHMIRWFGSVLQAPRQYIIQPPK